MRVCEREEREKERGREGMGEEWNKNDLYNTLGYAIHKYLTKAHYGVLIESLKLVKLWLIWHCLALLGNIRVNNVVKHS